MVGKSLIQVYVTFGCDPEFFFERDGQVIGSEKVLAEKPNPPRKRNPYGYYDPIPNELISYRRFVQDGVQAELNPHGNGCRANLAYSMAACFKVLKTHLAEMPGVSVSFKSMVEVSPEELDSLSPRSKALGCLPSLNIYEEGATVGVDGHTYRKRTAGGHIHLGLEGLLKSNAVKLVPILDLLVGNTSVLIDRDPHAAERRLHYGRAGEYRLPSHGLEYRTLSNFWMRSYQLMSLVMGLSRMSVAVLNTSQTLHGWDSVKELMKDVDQQKVRAAINHNDRFLAWENFQPVQAFIKKHVTYEQGMGLEKDSLRAFEYFLSRIDSEGIEVWFPEDPFDHWCKHQGGHGSGAESYFTNLRAKVPPGFHYLVSRPQVAAEIAPATINIAEVRRDALPAEVGQDVEAVMDNLASVEKRLSASVRAAARQRDGRGRFTSSGPVLRQRRRPARKVGEIRAAR
jgi:hypothetical protein